MTARPLLLIFDLTKGVVERAQAGAGAPRRGSMRSGVAAMGLKAAIAEATMRAGR